jgi:hypothetical protein
VLAPSAAAVSAAVGISAEYVGKTAVRIEQEGGEEGGHKDKLLA